MRAAEGPPATIDVLPKASTIKPAPSAPTQNRCLFLCKAYKVMANKRMKAPFCDTSVGSINLPPAPLNTPSGSDIAINKGVNVKTSAPQREIRKNKMAFDTLDTVGIQIPNRVTTSPSLKHHAKA